MLRTWECGDPAKKWGQQGHFGTNTDTRTARLRLHKGPPRKQDEAAASYEPSEGLLLLLPLLADILLVSLLLLNALFMTNPGTRFGFGPSLGVVSPGSRSQTSGSRVRRSASPASSEPTASHGDVFCSYGNLNNITLT